MQDAKSWEKATVNHWEYLFSPKMAVLTLFLSIDVNDPDTTQ